MPKNEEGEFELILGNKQLLSVFFIVVVLLGVFFTMGYIVGRNSPAAAPEAVADKKPVSSPAVVDSTPAPNPGKEEAASNSAPPAAPTETAPQQPEPVKSGPEKASHAKPLPVERAERAPSARAAAPPPKPAAKVEEHSSGTYLQLAATTQREADIEVDVLRKKGFRAMSAEIPEKPGMFRVLVGPVPEGGINKMKVDLQNAGFPGDKAIRRIM